MHTSRNSQAYVIRTKELLVSRQISQVCPPPPPTSYSTGMDTFLWDTSKPGPWTMDRTVDWTMDQTLLGLPMHTFCYLGFRHVHLRFCM